MKLNNKIYCDVCCKRIDNFTDEPSNCIIYGIENKERHYCMKHAYIGKKLHEISKTDGDFNPFILPLKTNAISKKMKRIYEDDDFVIDLLTEDHALRVSIFDDNHFKDEVFIKKSDYTGYLGSC